MDPYSVEMRENTDQKKLRIWTHFTQCEIKRIRKEKFTHPITSTHVSVFVVTDNSLRLFAAVFSSPNLLMNQESY